MKVGCRCVFEHSLADIKTFEAEGAPVPFSAFETYVSPRRRTRT